MNIRIQIPSCCILLLLLVAYSNSTAQTGPNLGTTSRLMNQALQAMEREEYDAANELFRQIVESNAPIPPEMPYYFAETLFQLGQFSNSANFLQKYLDLNGFSAEHYQQAKALQTKLEKPLAEIKACEFCDRMGYRFTTCNTCNGKKEVQQDCSMCRMAGVVGCSRCAGKGVVTKKNVFNILEYYDCERCHATGRLSCPRCEGTKVEFGACKTCEGDGLIPSDQICSHKENEALTNFQPVRTAFKTLGFQFVSIGNK
ncbi:molecular chaperone DnaJ [Lunatimonas salinarum]|uniref:molecular chaperone DnaJ n=1 Tax=Lunatimonas salinarum TaxID=1774590 RepID=UPI001ADED989|nr:molecular chaperone DnaJ [Lunatimonas salinarum]